VLADDEPDPDALAALAALPDPQWRVVEPTVVGMLAKVRGGARDALVEVLVRRGALERATRRTRSRSWVRRCQAAEMLGATRLSGSLPALVPLLDDRNREVRVVAARALGRVGTAEAVRPLLAAVSGQRALPARDVASALVLLEPSATALLVDASASEDPDVRSVVAEVLGLRDAVEGSERLATLLQDDDVLEVRIRSARALGRLGVPTATGPLSAALTSESPELRAVSARALGQVGATPAVEVLVRALGDPWHRVAANAATSLAALGPAGRAALRQVSATDGDIAGRYAAQALAIADVGRTAPRVQGA
jgi:HEAT repeat protein